MPARPRWPARRRHLSGWPDPTARAAFEAAYVAVLAQQWPVPVEQLWVDTHAGRTHVLVSGPPDAPPLVALHGAGLTATSWYPNIAAMSRGHRVFLPDSIFDRGLGEQQAFVVDHVDCAGWVRDLLDGLELPRPNLVGLSQGAWAAAATAWHHPERVARLALLAPAGTLRPFRAPFWLLFRGLQDVLPKRDPRKQAARVFSMVGLEPAEPFFSVVALGAQHFREQRPPAFPTAFPDAALSDLTMPVLLLLAEREVLYDHRKALVRARALVPDLTAAVVPGAGHFVTMAAPEVVDDHLARFLGTSTGPW